MRLVRLLVLGMVVGAMALTGCAKQPEEPAMEPKVAPPVIGEAGVLRAGVDLGYPPFAGEESGAKVGLDVDVAAAIADRLGLRLELTDIGSGGAAEALGNGDIDIALGALPITDAVLADVAFAGSYVVDGPAFFSVEASPSAETTEVTGIDPPAPGGKRVAAQQGSVAFWNLESEYGEGFTVAYDSLADAFDALSRGEVDLVACDAAVGAYIARDHASVTFAGQYGAGTPLGVAIAKDATDLETVVRETLDTLAAEGVLDTITAKWLGDLPKLSSGAASE